MPFTVSHVAAVLPGARTALPMAALVVGAMSPDIPYFLPRGPWALPTHTVGGIVLWAPLLGAVVVLAWYLLLARPAYAFAPDPLRRRLPERATARERLGSLRAVALVYAALVIGAATHVVWDAFTHNDGWVVERVPALMRTVAWLPGELAAYRWAQYASSPYLVGEEALNLRRATFTAITVGSAAAAVVLLVVAIGWTIAQRNRPPRSI